MVGGGWALSSAFRYPCLNYSCRRLATNSSDRTIRQFTLPTYPSPPDSGTTGGSSKLAVFETELEPTHRFNDPISKVSWHAISYSPDGEWLAGGKS